MQKITESRNKNIKKRVSILKREGVLDVTDPLAVSKHIAEKQKTQELKEIPVEKTETAKIVKKTVVKEIDRSSMIKADEAPATIERVAMYIPFAKVDKEKKLVSGIATSEALDSYGDIIRITAIEAALPDYLEFGNIREMHGPSAVGVVKDHELNKKEKHLYITVKVVDDNAWNKVTEAVYKGFSIGGRIIEAVPLKVKVPKDMVDTGYIDEKVLKDYANGVKTCADEETVEVFTGGYEILKLELIEISLVDRPACPEALIDSFKTANKQFVPDRVMILKTIEKQVKVLTKSKTLNTLAESLSTSQNSTNTINFLAQKFAMDEKVYQKVLAAVLNSFKAEGIDLSDEALEKAGSVRLNRSELKDVVVHTVQKSLELAKGEDGEGVEEAPTEEEAKSESEDTEEGVDAEESATTTEEGESTEETAETEAGETAEEVAEEKEGETTEEAPEAKEEEEAVEEKATEEETPAEATTEEPAKEPEEVKLTKAIKEVLSPLVKSVSTLEEKLVNLEKGIAGDTTQKGIDSNESSNGQKVFKGLFL